MRRHRRRNPIKTDTVFLVLGSAVVGAIGYQWYLQHQAAMANAATAQLPQSTPTTTTG